MTFQGLKAKSKDEGLYEFLRTKYKDNKLLLKKNNTSIHEQEK